MRGSAGSYFHWTDFPARFLNPGRALTLLLIALNLSACASTHIHSGEQRGIFLASEQDPGCKIVHQQSRWFLLFGLISLGSYDPSAHITDKTRSYRLREYTGWVDALITVLGGWALTLTRRQVEVQSCDSGQLIAVNPIQEQRRRQGELDEILLKYVKSRGEAVAPANQPLFALHSGETFQARILQIDNDKLLLETMTEDTTLGREIVVDRLTLRSGAQLDGTITEQARTYVKITTASGVTRVDKRLIQRIQYQVKTNEKIRKVVKSRRSISRAEIRAIILDPKGE